MKHFLNAFTSPNSCVLIVNTTNMPFFRRMCPWFKRSSKKLELRVKNMVCSDYSRTIKISVWVLSFHPQNSPSQTQIIKVPRPSNNEFHKMVLLGKIWRGQFLNIPPPLPNPPLTPLSPPSLPPIGSESWDRGTDPSTPAADVVPQDTADTCDTAAGQAAVDRTWSAGPGPAL